jgi:hypothetical protein
VCRLCEEGSIMDTKKYAIYHGRWQLSSVVMMAPMYFFSTYLALPIWIAFPIVHVIGAIMFWYIDGWIFADDDQKT